MITFPHANHAWLKSWKAQECSSLCPQKPVSSTCHVSFLAAPDNDHKHKLSLTHLIYFSISFRRSSPAHTRSMVLDPYLPCDVSTAEWRINTNPISHIIDYLSLKKSYHTFTADVTNVYFHVDDNEECLRGPTGSVAGTAGRVWGIRPLSCGDCESNCVVGGALEHAGWTSWQNALKGKVSTGVMQHSALQITSWLCSSRYTWMTSMAPGRDRHWIWPKPTSQNFFFKIWTVARWGARWEHLKRNLSQKIRFKIWTVKRGGACWL